MEIIIDKELKDLLVPQTAEERSCLEKSILENGYDDANRLVVWKDHNILVDGHNRFEVCKKHNIEFTYVEHEFDSKEEVINYMVDAQLSRRNIDPKTRQDLIGRKYNLEKKSRGGAKGNGCTLNTADDIAEKFNVSPRTVKSAGKYSESLDKLCETSLVSRQELMTKTSIRDVNEIAKLDVCEQKEVLTKIASGTSLREAVKIEKPMMISFSIASENKDKMVKMLGSMNKDQWINSLITEEWDRIKIN